ncbi:MAG: hypothetical protein K0R66_277 [Gammaproteobacteria bacterium]|jgi:hypothetical protein|nr:hypothetical protein [Gammaproteobacteria bacterium]
MISLMGDLILNGILSPIHPIMLNKFARVGGPVWCHPAYIKPFQTDPTEKGRVVWILLNLQNYDGRAAAVC